MSSSPAHDGDSSQQSLYEAWRAREQPSKEAFGVAVEAGAVVGVGVSPSEVEFHAVGTLTEQQVRFLVGARQHVAFSVFFAAGVERGWSAVGVGCEV